MENWAARQFLVGGRDVLIKAILQTIPSYAMSCFRISSSIFGDIERVCNNFWWGMISESNKIRWCTWDELCKPKSMGGLDYEIVLF